jgi:hypothetical protein
MTLKVLFVDGHHHADHFARRDFGFLVVLFECPANVAVFALDAERRRDKLHRWDDLIGGDALKCLNVLELLFS